MAGLSSYERQQIEPVLPPPIWAIQQGAGLVVMPIGASFDETYAGAIAPALASVNVNADNVRRVFDEASPPADITAALARAEIVVIDASGLDPAVMYVLGVAHAVGRCPIVLSREVDELPFGLGGVRCIEYAPAAHGRAQLRRRLASAARVFLAASRRK